MAELTVEEMDISGLVPTFSSAASGGDSFMNHGNTFIAVKNASGGSIDVTINVQKTVSVGGVTLTISDPTITVSDGDTEYIGPFDKDWFNDSDKMVNIDYSATSSVTVAVVKV